MITVLFCLKLIVYCRLLHFLLSIKIIEWSGSSVKFVKKTHKDCIKEQEKKIYHISDFIFDSIFYHGFFLGIILVLFILALICFAIYFVLYFEAFLLYEIILMLKVLVNFIF